MKGSEGSFSPEAPAWVGLSTLIVFESMVELAKQLDHSWPRLPGFLSRRRRTASAAFDRSSIMY